MANAVVIGGTGMLAGTVAGLLAQGYRVLAPSRHPGELAGAEEFEADWTDPTTLVDRVAEHADGPIDLAIVWCHRPFRTEIVERIGALLAPGAKLVEVLGSTAVMDLWDKQPPGDSVFVMLGHKQLDNGTGRWLTHQEISDAVLGAVERPAGSTLVAGSLD